MANTPNLNLVKPASTDNYTIDVPNGNMDIIDAAVKALQDGTTAAQVLAKILSVDGAGSGLDADKLDGQEGSYYMPDRPPGKCSAISVTTGTGSVQVKWTDPNDAAVEGVTLVKWAGTKLLRKTGSYPASITDGTVVVDSTVRNQYQSSGYNDTGLTDGTTYYYRLFPYSDTGKVNEESGQTATGTAGSPWPTSGLLARYSLDAIAAGATTVADDSGNGRTLNCSSALASGDVQASGKVGKAVNITPSDKVLQSAAVLSGIGSTGNLSMAAWCRFDTFTDTRGVVRIGKIPGGTGDGNKSLSIKGYSDSTLGLYAQRLTADSGAGNNGKGLGSPSLATWYHVYVELERSGANDIVRISVNNGTLQEYTWAGNIDFGTNSYIWIGSDNKQASRNMDGDVDQVYVYNRLLNATERGQLYNAGVGV